MQQKVWNWEVIKYFFQKMWELKWYAFLTILWVTIATVNGLLIPIYFKEIIDIISLSWEKAQMMSEIHVYFIYFIITVVVTSITWRGLDYILDMRSNKLDYNISIECFLYIHKHSYNFFINNFAWAINKKVGRLIWAMQWLSDIAFREITRFIISFFFVIGVVSYQNIYLWIGFLVYVVVFIFLSLFLNKYRVPYVERASRENSKVGGIYADTIVNNFNISIFWTLAKEVKNIQWALDNWMKLEKKSVYVYIAIFAILSVISLISEIGLLYFTIYLWSLWNITVGTFVLILTYQMTLSWQIFSLSFLFGRMSSHIGNAIEMLDVLSTPHEIKDIEGAKKLHIQKGNIEFKNIWFLYNQDVKVFEKFSLSIKSWEKIWVVWASGSGKSSLVKLLFRLYDIQSWEILIDGQDISKVSQDSLRSQISMVPQDTILFHRTLRENIAYGKENATETEIENASKKSHSYEFISKLKDGYETLVGERWIKLSGWERQRVSIARAMLQDNKILVLDEATSALDSESEKLIQDALENLMKEKTMIVIAHRLSTIMKMDRIIVMNEGKIIEEGTHKELLEKSWTYKKLWEIQSWGFLGE